MVDQVLLLERNNGVTSAALLQRMRTGESLRAIGTYNGS